MSKIINLSMAENIISFTADYIIKSGRTNTCVISGGKRPALFLKKELFEKLKMPFLPPKFFTNESFIETFTGETYSKIPDIEAAYIIFEIVKNEAPSLLKGRKSFAEFMQWAFEILSFIEQLDLENVSEERLKNIKANADIGYDVPGNINELLKNIFKIRNSFHKICEKTNRITKGMAYLKAAKSQPQNLTQNFDEIILLAPFYLHKSELEIYKKIYDLGKLTVITQGEPREYSELAKIHEYFGQKLPAQAPLKTFPAPCHSGLDPESCLSQKDCGSGAAMTTPAPCHTTHSAGQDLQIFNAYDSQSEALLLKNILSELKEEELSKTAVIVPLTKELPSIISEIAALTQNYNVSAGYPASKTSVFSLIYAVIEAQLSRKGKHYYAKDIISVLTNPLVKNMRFFADASVSRIAAHKIEQALVSTNSGGNAAPPAPCHSELIGAPPELCHSGLDPESCLSQRDCGSGAAMTTPAPCHSRLESIFSSSNEPAPQCLNAGESISPLNKFKSSKAALSGKIFLEFEEIYENEDLLEDISAAASQAWKPLGKTRVKETLKDMFDILFCNFEKAGTLSLFSEILENFLKEMSSYSVAQSYPLNAQSISALLDTAKNFKTGEVSKIRFEKEDILNIFKNLISNIHLSLPGSPLKGLQVLGFLEARNLSFENIFIVSMTDSALPASKKESPLIPKDIMFALGIEMAKKELEIQKYHFQRIISGAKKIRLIYPQNSKDERSRFIEELIWKEQFAKQDLDAVKVKSLIMPEIIVKKEEKRKYKKTAEIKNFLKNLTYSYSKIDAYLKCRLEFYFKYVLGLDETDAAGKDASNADMGIFIHKFLQTVFHKGFKSAELKDDEFKKFYLQELEKQFDASFNLKLREDAFLIKKVLNYRLENLLEREKERDFDFVEACEEKFSSKIETPSGLYKLECIIDRIDAKGKNRIILDYKTGSVPDRIVKTKFDALTAKLSRKNIKKAVESLQLPLYKYIFEKETGFTAPQCALYAIKTAEIRDFPEENDIYEKCIEIIKFILDEINSGDFFEFDNNDADKCKTCKYFYLCR